MIRVDPQTEMVSLTAVHDNPTFVRLANADDTAFHKMAKDEAYVLAVGDEFSLMAKNHFYQLVTALDDLPPDHDADADGDSSQRKAPPRKNVMVRWSSSIERRAAGSTGDAEASSDSIVARTPSNELVYAASPKAGKASSTSSHQGGAFRAITDATESFRDSQVGPDEPRTMMLADSEAVPPSTRELRFDEADEPGEADEPENDGDHETARGPHGASTGKVVKRAATRGRPLPSEDAAEAGSATDDLAAVGTRTATRQPSIESLASSRSSARPAESAETATPKTRTMTRPPVGPGREGGLASVDSAGDAFAHDIVPNSVPSEHGGDSDGHDPAPGSGMARPELGARSGGGGSGGDPNATLASTSVSLSPEPEQFAAPTSAPSARKRRASQRSNGSSESESPVVGSARPAAAESVANRDAGLGSEPAAKRQKLVASHDLVSTSTPELHKLASNRAERREQDLRQLAVAASAAAAGALPGAPRVRRGSSSLSLADSSFDDENLDTSWAARRKKLRRLQLLLPDVAEADLAAKLEVLNGDDGAVLTFFANGGGGGSGSGSLSGGRGKERGHETAIVPTTPPTPAAAFVAAPPSDRAPARKTDSEFARELQVEEEQRAATAAAVGTAAGEAASAGLRRSDSDLARELQAQFDAER